MCSVYVPIGTVGPQEQHALNHTNCNAQPMFFWQNTCLRMMLHNVFKPGDYCLTLKLGTVVKSSRVLDVHISGSGLNVMSRSIRNPDPA